MGLKYKAIDLKRALETLKAISTALIRHYNVHLNGERPRYNPRG